MRNPIEHPTELILVMIAVAAITLGLVITYATEVLCCKAGRMIGKLRP